ncbi:BLUF domain-containing protein [Microbacterium sp. SSW1-49]|uniref:BLUF domain-containing protein n=1 Tax=Microbacterium croceum TaxID=2851645 RepID=A0ABT0FA32_9MICO|nr:BLUF domain-containing protein [Microbacterium croceum]MCK2034789.1 BLUF domain-containing protein [Microbacterium croceum]
MTAVSADDLVSLVYTSTAVRPLDDDALSGLLAQSRDANGARAVTGMLLYRDGRFIQVLEGARGVVTALAAVIARDGRHRGMRILLLEGISARQFPDWTMGYQSLSRLTEPRPDGYRDSFADLDVDSDRSRTVRALSELSLWFRVRARR